MLLCKLLGCNRQKSEDPTRDQPMDLADAALVRIAERDGVKRIFTLDRRDFNAYRPKRFRRFSIIP